MKHRIYQLVIFSLLLTPVLASAASPTVPPSDRKEDQCTLDLHVTWNGINVVGAPVCPYTKKGTHLDRCTTTDARGHVQFSVPTTPQKFKVDYRGKEYWTGNLFAIAGQKLEVEVPLERLADICTNNPTAARYDGEPPVFNHEPIQVASIGTYVGILSQASVSQVQPQSKVYYFITDHLGTPMKMTDESGAVVWSADYRPFGELSVSNGTVANNFRFPGQYYDLETGLHYNYHRYYQPKIGRYVAPDPIGIGAEPNLFGYSESDPVSKYDPLGLWPTRIHNKMISSAFSSLPPNLQKEIERGSRYADDFQDPRFSYMHAMRQKGQSVDLARKLMEA